MCKPQDQRGQPHLDRGWVKWKSHDTWVADNQGCHWWESLEIVALLQLLETIWLQQFKKFLLWLVLSDNFPGSGSLSPKRAACRNPASQCVLRGLEQWLISWLSRDMGAGLFCCHCFGHWHLKSPHKDVPEPGLAEVQHPVSVQGHRYYYMGRCRGRGETAFSQKSEDISLELPLGVIIFLKQYNNGIRRLYILPVLIPRCIFFNSQENTL